MATGYTLDVEKGISFEKFIMKCARGFGACVTLRDSSAPIPEKFEPSPYHKNKIANIKREITKLKDMTPFEALRKSKQEHAKEIKYHIASDELQEALRTLIAHKWAVQVATKAELPTRVNIDMPKKLFGIKVGVNHI